MKTFWWFIRPVTIGVCAIVVDDQERILLVRTTYRRGWYFPGGGVKRGESARDAIKRELIEEVNIECLEDPAYWGGPYYCRIDNKNDHVILFLVRQWRQNSNISKSFEIETMCFFSRDELPPDVAPGVSRRINEYFEGIRDVYRW